MSLNRSQFNRLASDLHDPEVGGFTINAVTGERPTSGIAVSYSGREQRTPLADTSGRTIKKYAKANKDKLGHQPNTTYKGRFENALGGWSSGDTAHLDVSKVYPGDAAGQVRARHHILEHNQIAGYNIGTGQEIMNPFHPEAYTGDVSYPGTFPDRSKSWWASSPTRALNQRLFGSTSGKLEEGESFS